MSYDVFTSEQVADYVEALDDKSRRIVVENLERLAGNPYPRPDAGGGDREKVKVDGEEIYRLHIGRSYTAFYDVLEDEKRVHVVEITTIEDAHKKYG